MITPDEAERVAIIMEGCKVSESYAEKLHREQAFSMQIKENHIEAKVARLRELAESHRKPMPLNAPKRGPVVDRKSLAAGEENV